MRRLVAVLFILCSCALSGVCQLKSVSFEMAKSHVEQGEYDQANKQFLVLLHPDSTLPDELCYYFGKSLYWTGYVEQSEQLLRKYLELTDTAGNFYDSTIAYIQLISGRTYQPQSENVEVDTAQEAEVLSSGDAGDPCQGNDYVICPICNGSGVIVSEGTFGNYYRACPYSDGHGRMPCSNFMEYQNGNLIEIKEQDK